MTLVLAAGLLALMAWEARRMDRRLDPAVSALPMNFVADGSALWRAPRQVALWFVPALAGLVLVALEVVAPGTPASLIGVAPLLAGQLFYHRILSRSA